MTIQQLQHLVAARGLLAINCPHRPLSDCAFSSDGSLLATGSWSGLVKIWNMPSCTQATSMRVGDARVTGVAWHPHASMEPGVLALAAGACMTAPCLTFGFDHLGLQCTVHAAAKYASELCGTMCGALWNHVRCSVSTNAKGVYGSHFTPPTQAVQTIKQCCCQRMAKRWPSCRGTPTDWLEWPSILWAPTWLLQATMLCGGCGMLAPGSAWRSRRDTVGRCMQWLFSVKGRSLQLGVWTLLVCVGRGVAGYKAVHGDGCCGTLMLMALMLVHVAVWTVDFTALTCWYAFDKGCLSVHVYL